MDVIPVYVSYYFSAAGDDLLYNNNNNSTFFGQAVAIVIRRSVLFSSDSDFSKPIFRGHSIGIA